MYSFHISFLLLTYACTALTLTDFLTCDFFTVVHSCKSASCIILSAVHQWTLVITPRFIAFMCGQKKKTWKSRRRKLWNDGLLTFRRSSAGSCVGFMQRKKESSGCQWSVCLLSLFLMSCGILYNIVPSSLSTLCAKKSDLRNIENLVVASLLQWNLAHDIQMASLSY